MGFRVQITCPCGIAEVELDHENEDRS